MGVALLGRMDGKAYAAKYREKKNILYDDKKRMDMPLVRQHA
jgi:hypothetical protein